MRSTPLHAPGEAYQFDWSNEVIVLDGVTNVVKGAQACLCHSRMPLVRASRFAKVTSALSSYECVAVASAKITGAVSTTTARIVGTPRHEGGPEKDSMSVTTVANVCRRQRKMHSAPALRRARGTAVTRVPRIGSGTLPGLRQMRVRKREAGVELGDPSVHAKMLAHPPHQHRLRSQWPAPAKTTRPTP